jgi:hypothetical protein
MDLKILLDTPPWEWPRDTGKRFLEILRNNRANQSDRMVAAELAGDITVVNDDMAHALMAVVGSPDEPPKIRAKAAISLGPALELAYTDEFDDPEFVPISESVFHDIQESFQKLYSDNQVPKGVRRRILEASVRAPEPWHQDGIPKAYASGDRDWMLTAVFSMRYVHGFGGLILEALKSADPEIHYEAVRAAGSGELDAAWDHVAALVTHAGTPKPLLLAAIDAAGSIRPAEALEILHDLTHSGDEDIAEAAEEAIAMAEGFIGQGDEEDEDEDEEEDEEEGEDDWVN